MLSIGKAIALLLGGVVLASCSLPTPTKYSSETTDATPAPAMPTARSVKDPSIPGLGATREDWDASHTPTPGLNPEGAFGSDPTLPTYVANKGAVYAAVTDEQIYGLSRITGYTLHMHSVDRQEALARARQELPADSSMVWELKLDQCYRVGFESPELAKFGRMAMVQLQEFQPGGLTTDSSRYNEADFEAFAAGSHSDPSIGC